MEYAVLGTVEAKRDGVPLPLGGPKQRALLALLMLDANRPVSRDRLIEGLWGESPPASASASLDTYVSRLRGLLGADRLERRPPGYAIRVEQGELDLLRFETLLGDAHAAPTPGERSRLLHEALRLWRGPPLADLQFAPFASVEIERLDERRLMAIEQRIDADLEMGAASELVGELEHLVRRHPLRERLVGQLMLALYRSGRQADALTAFRSTRQRLALDLGLEPGPELRALELRILQHDPGLLGGRARARPPAHAPAVARHRILIMVGAIAAVAAVVAWLALRDGPATPAQRARLAASRLVAIDASSRRLRAQSTLTEAPAALVDGFGSLWAADPNGGEVLRIDQATGAVVDRIAVGGQPSGLAVGGGGVWVASAVGGLVTRIDPAAGRRTQTVRLGGANPAGVVFSGHSLWVADATDRSLVRIDPETGSVRQTIGLDLAPTTLAAGDGEIWAAGYDSATVDRVNLSSGQVVDTIPVGQGPAAVLVAAGSVWVANSLDATLTRIDVATGQTRAATPVGSQPSALASAAGSIWVANEYSGTITRVDPHRGDVRETLHPGGRPSTLAFAGPRLWVGEGPAAGLHRGGTLTLSGTAHLTTVDPGFEDIAEPTQLPRLAYDTLVTFDNAPGAAGLRLVPDLALQLPHATDGDTTYAFRLRPGIRYSNGRAVKAGDFRRAIERLFRAHAQGTTFYTSIVGARRCVDRPSDCDLSRGIVAENAGRTVIFHLNQPDPDFLFKLTEFAYTAPVPPGTPDRNLKWQPLPGTGPYRIVQASRNGVRLERNPFFHEWSHAAQPDGNPDAIVWRFPPTHDAEIRDIEQGKADWTLDFIPVGQLRAIERNQPELLHVNPAFIVEFIPLNTNIAPFDSLKVRQALNYAIDRRRIAELYGGALVATPLCQPLPPGMPGYVPRCRYTDHANARGAYNGPDLQRARALVAASGRSGAHVTVWGAADATAIPPALPAYVAHVLRSIGFKATLHLVSFDTITPGTRRSIQLSVDGDWLPDFPTPSSYLPSFFGCHGGHVHGYYCNPKLDRLMQRATLAEQRAPAHADRLWATASRRITDQGYWVPTVNLREVDLVSRRLRNYEFHPVWGFLADQAQVR